MPEEFQEDACQDDVIVEGCVAMNCTKSWRFGCRKVDKYVRVEGRELLNMEGTDFLGLLTSDRIEKTCVDCIQQYGVGSCGPRAFYGTTDVQESIVYSFDIATAPSVLPAFANRKDVIVMDECVHYPIQTGCHLSRAKIHAFKHNDMEDLERILIEVDRQHQAQKKPLNRRFIVVEGIYHDCGDVAPLDEIYRLKCKYKYRLIVDESLAFGVMGETGRGVCEEFGLAPNQVDLVTASLSNAMASVGGFCAGDHDIVGHQRLNGHGYIFSASLPPFLAAAADVALTCLEEKSDALKAVKEKARALRRALSEIPELKVYGDLDSKDAMSPLMHLGLADGDVEDGEARRKLKEMAGYVREERGILVAVPEYTGLESKVPKPTMKLAVTAKHSEKELMMVRDAIAEAARCYL